MWLDACLAVHGSTCRYKRQQLVQLQQLDGKLFWCGLRELAANCSCLLLAHNPGAWPVVKAGKRLDTGSIQAQQLLLVDSPEPTRLLVSLGMGPQHAALPLPVPPPQVCQTGCSSSVCCAQGAGPVMCPRLLTPVSCGLRARRCSC
jgi:hypothetical protein